MPLSVLPFVGGVIQGVIFTMIMYLLFLPPPHTVASLTAHAQQRLCVGMSLAGGIVYGAFVALLDMIITQGGGGIGLLAGLGWVLAAGGTLWLLLSQQDDPA
jgi:hypothetical protein